MPCLYSSTHDIIQDVAMQITRSIRVGRRLNCEYGGVVLASALTDKNLSAHRIFLFFLSLMSWAWISAIRRVVERAHH